MARSVRYEFHSHTFLSDGGLHPIELIRRAHVAGHNAIALTDHVGLRDAQDVVPRLVRECEAAME
jgi:predicted metal-dependent phosphoesterase TrpH